MFKKQVSIKVDYSSHAFIDNLRFYWLLNKFPKEKTGRFCRDIWQLSCFLSDFNLRTVLQVVGHIFPFLPPFYDKHFCWKKNNLQITTPTPLSPFTKKSVKQYLDIGSKIPSLRCLLWQKNTLFILGDAEVICQKFKFKCQFQQSTMV